MKNTIVCLIYLFTTIIVFAQEIEKKRHLDCYWAEKPPVLDGKLDDACWEKAQVATSFILISTDKKPSNSTEVKCCYDADNLYVAWKLSEKNMKGLKYGPPEDIRDNIDWTGDAAELFLSPGRNKKYYHLCASPLGSRYDAFMYNKNFNPDWKVKTRINNDYWTIEMVIPFASLVMDGEFRGTPLRGDVWGIQFCRDQGYLRNWSAWRTNDKGGFHKTEHFGSLRFLGIKNTNEPVSVKNKSYNIFFGTKRKFEFKLSRKTSGLRAVANLQHNGQSVFKKEIPVIADQFSFSVAVLQGGMWDLSVDVYNGKQKVYHGFGLKELPSIFNTFKTIAKEKIDKNLADCNYPEKEKFRQKLKELRLQCSTALKQLEIPDKLNELQWHELFKLYYKVNTSWEKISFELNLIDLYNKAKLRDSSFALGQAGAQTKIYPYTLYKGKINAPIKISLAGRERESRQIVVIPFGTELKNIKISFGDLKGKDGKIIKSDNFKWFAVEYVKINKKPNIKKSFYHKYEPDILRENMMFNVKENTLRPLWFDFHLPEDTPEGLYKGTVEVVANGNSIKLPLEITSYGFNIPKKTTLKNSFWFYPTYRWQEFYGGFGKNGYSPELHRKHAKILSRYRVDPFVFDYGVYWHPKNLKIFYEKDGRFSFDFSKWEEFIKTGLENGGNFFVASMGCNIASLRKFISNRKITSRTTGNKMDIYKCYPEMKKYKKLFKDKKYVDALKNNRFYHDFMNAYLKLLKKTNVENIAHWEYFDEPNANHWWISMLDTHSFLRKNYPWMNLYAFGVYPERKQILKKSIGYIDMWAPSLYKLANNEILYSIKERQRKFKENFMFYTCNTSYDTKGNYTPHMRYYQSYLAPRMHPWMAYKYGCDAFMVFMLNSIPKENMPKKGKSKKLWTDTEWLAGKYNGTGVLIYPGPNYEIIPSMRLASFRDGLEDYEYFVYLRKLQTYIDKDKYSRLYKQIDKELQIEDNIVKDVYYWTKNVELLEVKRDRLASLIKQTLKVIEKEAIK